MAGSSFGTIFKITTWGESHGKAVGVVVDGCPAGVPICEEDIQVYMDRRKPGQSEFTTQRKEEDSIQILSGVFEGKTTGTPISMLVFNKDHHSTDYSEIASYYRPGHADYTFDEKYGFRDYRGGGRSSGRETLARVAGGAVAMKVLETLGISVHAYTKQIGPVTADQIDLEEAKKNSLCMPDKESAVLAAQYAKKMMEAGDSVGGIIECVLEGMPVGVGETVFDKLSANLAKAITSIGAVKGFELGDGFMVSKASGSTNNDSFITDENGNIIKATNHSGGILGGMSDGDAIVLRAAFKPTPSISATQKTVSKDGEEIEIKIKGRHDPMIVPRAVVVVEAMTAITALDMLLLSMTSRIDKIKAFFEK